MTTLFWIIILINCPFINGQRRRQYDLRTSCRHESEWTIKGRQIMKQLVGKTTLVALMPLGCSHCQQQLKGLQGMADQFRASNMADLRIVIVAPHNEDHGFIKYWKELFKNNKEIRIVQETREEPVWSKLRAQENDIHIYDKCGRQVFLIRSPQSSLRQAYVMHNLWQTYNTELCGPCVNGISDHDPYFSREYKGSGKPKMGRPRKAPVRRYSTAVSTPSMTTTLPPSNNRITKDAGQTDQDAPDIEITPKETTPAPSTTATSSWWDVGGGELITNAPEKQVNKLDDLFAETDPDYFKTATSSAVEQIPAPQSTQPPEPKTTTPYVKIRPPGCEEYRDEDCAELQQMSMNDSMEFNKTADGLLHDCCYKGIYLTDICDPMNCNNNSYSICCFQKLLQAHYVCCHDTDMDGDEADEFNRCCFTRFVFIDAHDPCCPAEKALEYWDDKSDLHELCLPNIKINYEGLSFSAKMRDGNEATMDVSNMDVLHYKCPYSTKRGTFLYYKPFITASEDLQLFLP